MRWLAHRSSLTSPRRRKAFLTAVSDREVGDDIADEVLERLEVEPTTLALLGAGKHGGRGRCPQARAEQDDARGRRVAERRLVGVDLNEQQLLDLLDGYRHSTLVVSPIGAQGFVLGRGNQQLSPEVLRRIGPANVIVIATPTKLRRTPVLRFDTGDRALDEAFIGNGFVEVVTGYHTSRLARAAN